MKRSFRSFLIVAGLILSTYAFSAYNVSTGTSKTAPMQQRPQPTTPLLFIFSH